MIKKEPDEKYRRKKCSEMIDEIRPIVRGYARECRDNNVSFDDWVNITGVLSLNIFSDTLKFIDPERAKMYIHAFNETLLDVGIRDKEGEN